MERTTTIDPIVVGDRKLTLPGETIVGKPAPLIPPTWWPWIIAGGALAAAWWYVEKNGGGRRGDAPLGE